MANSIESSCLFYWNDEVVKRVLKEPEQQKETGKQNRWNVNVVQKQTMSGRPEQQYSH